MKRRYKKIYDLHAACTILDRIEWKAHEMKSENDYRTIVRFDFTFKHENQFKYLIFRNLRFN